MEKNPKVVVPWNELDPFLNRYVTCLTAKKRLDIKNFRAWPCYGICSCKILRDLQSLMSVSVSQSSGAHSKISPFIKIVWCESSKFPLPEPRRKGSIFSRHLLHSETFILYFFVHLLWSPGQDVSILKNLSLCSQSGCFAKCSFLSGCSVEWLFWSLVYWDCASPLKSSHSITPLCHFLVTKEMPPTMEEAVQLMRMFPAKPSAGG